MRRRPEPSFAVVCSRRSCWGRSSSFSTGSTPPGDLTVFVLSACALVPLSWLIGEATDNLAVGTGPGIGDFLNATFGNAPELIIAIVALPTA